ncbi:hypothetical protein [Herminiimonas sp. CN]|uniref:hypothetical protein n=1 Tax=Herminiimonas sp. CN TaxID=1349818 RepID=UPI000473CE73|nr:hypothetical protein [Herminiimonas sp. CN]
MCVFIIGKVVETDAGIYEFADLDLAEKFINCLIDTDEISACKQVPAVNTSAKPDNTFFNRWAKVFNIPKKIPSRGT